MDWEIDIVDTETKVDEKRTPYTAYKVSVKCGPRLWFVLRRYADFADLCTKLDKKFPNRRLLEHFPPKKVLGNMDREFIENRKKQLQSFLKSVVQKKDDVARSPEVTLFLSKERQLDPRGSMTSSHAHEYYFKNKDKSQEKVTIEDFTLHKVVGTGNLGKVMLVSKKDTGEYYAMKILNKEHVVQQDETEHILTEKRVLTQGIKHPFLVGVHYCFQTNDKLYFVLDYINGGELFFHLQRESTFSEDRVRFYAAEIILALEFLHNIGVVYRDLKPENVLLDSDGHIAITDFGLAKDGIDDEAKTKTFCGTPEYLAPEVVLGERYGKEVDWWCLGTVVYEMLCGCVPFYNPDVQEMYKNILSANIKYPQTLSDQAVSFMMGLLKRNPEERLGSRGVEEIKSHAFFKGIDWKKLIKKELVPPFRPQVKDSTDTSNFDPEFTEQSVRLSIKDSMLSSSQQNRFRGWTYSRKENADQTD